MEEDIIITLLGTNPQKPKNRIRFNYSTGTYVTVKLVERMIDHLNIESTSVLKSSEEGKVQLQFEQNARGKMDPQ